MCQATDTTELFSGTLVKKRFGTLFNKIVLLDIPPDEREELGSKVGMKIPRIIILSKRI